MGASAINTFFISKMPSNEKCQELEGKDFYSIIKQKEEEYKIMLNT